MNDPTAINIYYDIRVKLPPMTSFDSTIDYLRLSPVGKNDKAGYKTSEIQFLDQIKVRNHLLFIDN